MSIPHESLFQQPASLGGPEDQTSVELSPDGTRVLASLLDPERRGRDLWIYDVRQNRRDRLTFDVGDEITGTWSPDGTQIVFSSRRTSRFDLYRKAASGAGSEELLLSDGHDKVPYSWSDHDQLIAYANRTPSATATEDLWTVPLSGARKPTEFLRTEFGESRPRFSPDGRWLAYVSNESGQPQVFVTPFPARSSKWQVSTAGGDWPRWRRDGKELFYVSPDNTLMVAAVSGKSAAFHVGVVEPLFKARPRRTAYGGAVEYAYDVSADGQRFLVNTLLENASMDPITVLVNWPALLKK